MKANAQTYHFKSFWTHQGVILEPLITNNKVEPVLWDTLYNARELSYILKWPWIMLSTLLLTLVYI